MMHFSFFYCSACYSFLPEANALSVKEGIFKNTLTAAIMIGGILFLSGCSKSDDDQPCGSVVISSTNDICLTIEHNGLTQAHRDIIENNVSVGIADINNLMPINKLRIRIVQNPGLVIPEIGMGGYNPDEGEVILAIDANYPDLEESLEENLIPQLAHEVHHAKRRRSVGYGNTLLEAVVTEGLADHFSIEVTGTTPPPWAVALTGAELQDWIDMASTSWDESPYNHQAWFVGADPAIPKWAGYSIGFEIVKNYLLDHPGRHPSDLHDEPASSIYP